MVTAVTAPIGPHPLSGGVGEPAEHLRRESLMGSAFEHGLRPQGIGLSLIPSHLEADNTVLQRRIVQIGHTRLDRIIEPLQA